MADGGRLPFVSHFCIAAFSLSCLKNNIRGSVLSPERPHCNACTSWAGVDQARLAAWQQCSRGGGARGKADFQAAVRSPKNPVRAHAPELGCGFENGVVRLGGVQQAEAVSRGVSEAAAEAAP